MRNNTNFVENKTKVLHIYGVVFFNDSPIRMLNAVNKYSNSTFYV